MQMAARDGEGRSTGVGPVPFAEKGGSESNAEKSPKSLKFFTLCGLGVSISSNALNPSTCPWGGGAGWKVTVGDIGADDCEDDDNGPDGTRGGGGGFDEARNSSQGDEVLLEGEVPTAAGAAGDDGDREPLSSTKSKPESRSISVDGCFFNFGINLALPTEELEGVLEKLDGTAPLGGGASGFGRTVDFELSIDSRLAISSVRPDSMDRRSPIPLSDGGADIEGTSERYEKSSAESSRSRGSTEGVLGAEGFRASRPKKRETTEGPPG